MSGQSHVAYNPSFSGQGSGDGDHSRPSSSPTEPSSNPQLTTVLSNKQQPLQSLSVRMEKLERHHNPVSSVAPQVLPGTVSGTNFLMQAPAYSCPSVMVISNHLSISGILRAWILQINIFYGTITSAGVALPLPLDSC